MPKGKVKPEDAGRHQVHGRQQTASQTRHPRHGLPGHATWRLGRDHLRNPRPRHAHRPLEPETLAPINPIFKKRCERDGMAPEDYWLGDDDLEPDTSSPLNIERPTEMRRSRCRPTTRTTASE